MLALAVFTLVMGVSERQVRNHRSAYKKYGIYTLTNKSRYKPVSEFKEYGDIIRDDLLSSSVAIVSEAVEPQRGEAHEP